MSIVSQAPLADKHSLLEAAPDLLATLQIIERGACLRQMHGDKCGCYPCIARDAIAKATA